MATTFGLLSVILAQWVVIFYPGVLLFWLIIHGRIERWRAIGTPSYWVAAVAWTMTSGPLLVLRRDIFSLRWTLPLALEFPVSLLGTAAFLFGVLLLRQATRKISVRTMIGFPELQPATNPQAILNSGVYSRTRNPIYLAHWLVVLSAAMLTNFAANWVLFGVDCVVLPLLIRFEERELLGRYGPEYASYMRRVPRFFPQLG